MIGRVSCQKHSCFVIWTNCINFRPKMIMSRLYFRFGTIMSDTDAKNIVSLNIDVPSFTTIFLRKQRQILLDRPEKCVVRPVNESWSTCHFAKLSKEFLSGIGSYTPLDEFAPGLCPRYPICRIPQVKRLSLLKVQRLLPQWTRPKSFAPRPRARPFFNRSTRRQVDFSGVIRQKISTPDVGKCMNLIVLKNNMFLKNRYLIAKLVMKDIVQW